MTFFNDCVKVLPNEVAMTLKEKRQKAFLEYINIIFEIEPLLYSYKNIVLQAPSLQGDVNNFGLSSFELIFTSISAVQEKYKKNYEILKDFLEKAIFFHDKYKLNFVKEIDDIKSKINEISSKLDEIKKIKKTAPIMEINEKNFRESVDIYDNYINEIFDIVLTIKQKIDISKFDYRIYFKDGFYKYMKMLDFLTDLTAGSGHSLVNMRTCSVINALDDENWVEDITTHYPSNIKQPKMR